MSKLTEFVFEGRAMPVRFIETMTVKDGVECDTYAFTEDDTKDLAIVRVQKGYKTPLQRVLLGAKTIEGFVDGNATLIVQESNGQLRSYGFGTGKTNEAVMVELGQIMQWHADGDTGLTFYEICEPPYADGRFENLAEEAQQV